MFRKTLLSIAFLFLLLNYLSISPISAHEDAKVFKCTIPYAEPSLKYEITSPSWISNLNYDKAIHKDVYGYNSKNERVVISTEHLGYERVSEKCDIWYTKELSGRYTTGIEQYKGYGEHEKPNTVSSPNTRNIYWTNEVDIFLKDGSGKTFLKGTSNGTSSNKNPVDGNPSNTNNSFLTTYSNEPMPTVECIKTYGDDTTKSCKGSIEKVVDERFNGKAGQRLTCYYYEDPLTKDSDKVCTVRVYVKNVSITGAPDISYPGKHYNLTCKATFQDGTVQDISNEDYTFLSYPAEKDIKAFRVARYIGTYWKDGYKDLRGVKHKPDSLSDFYPVDPGNRDYLVNCSYYQDYDWLLEHYGKAAADTRVKSDNGIISDADVESGKTSWNVVRKNEVAIQHYGIKKIWMEVTGGFAVKGKPSEYVEKTLLATSNEGTFPGGWDLVDEEHDKIYSPGYWNQFNFHTGSWYDFKAYVEYNNGVKSEITSAPETYWDNTPWFENLPKHTARNVYDSGMSKTGLDHRIPRDGWNTIDVEYLHQDVPYGSSMYGKTKVTNRLKALQVKQLNITHKDSNTKAPITLIKEGAAKKIDYKAWVTWNDGTKEDWTIATSWRGDYSSSPAGTFDFTSLKGKDQKTTVHAVVENVDDLTGTVVRSSGTSGGVKNVKYNSQKDQWNLNQDEIEVTVSDCRNIDHLAAGCSLPTDYWRTNFKDNFDVFNKYADPNTNYYPDPRIFGYSKWSVDNDLYSFERKFPVSGTSSGLGN